MISDSSNVNNLGNFIKEKRLSLGLKQVDVADCLCISEKAFSKIETGKNGLSAMHIIPLCEMLHVDSRELMRVMFGTDGIDNSVVYRDPHTLRVKDVKNISAREHVMRVCLISGLICHLLTFDDINIYDDFFVADCMSENLDVRYVFNLKLQTASQTAGYMWDALYELDKVLLRLADRANSICTVKNKMSSGEMITMFDLLQSDFSCRDKFAEFVDHYLSGCDAYYTTHCDIFHMLSEYMFACSNGHNYLYQVMTAFLYDVHDKGKDRSAISEYDVIDFIYEHDLFKKYESDCLPVIYDLTPKIRDWSDKLFSITMDLMMSV